MSADRPRNLLIYVNPYGGNKSAEAIYSRQVSPLLQEMGVTHQAVVTDRPGHAKHHVMEEADLASVDGLVCVGGDGTYAEVPILFALCLKGHQGFEFKLKGA